MKTPITYYGGKQLMADKIISIFPEHVVYVEPYFGGGAVYFRKKPSRVEVINDLNENLITFYMQLQNNSEELISMIKNTIHHESLHKHAREVYNKRVSYTEVEMAWAVWYMTNGSFTASPHGSWKYDNGRSGSDSAHVLANKRSRFNDQFYHRIKNTQISCREATRVIRDRDTENTLFFLDPPYPGANQKHYSGFGFKEYRELLEILSEIKGKFILTNYWSQTLRYFYTINKWYKLSFRGHVVINRIKSNQGEMVTKDKNEVIITNYKPPEVKKDVQYKIII